MAEDEDRTPHGTILLAGLVLYFGTFATSQLWGLPVVPLWLLAVAACVCGAGLRLLHNWTRRKARR